MIRIFLVRHGQSEANLDKSVHHVKADHAIILSEEGKEQAKRAGQFLNTHIKERFYYHQMEWNGSNDIWHGALFRFWVSPYQRTRQTAAIIRAEMQGINTDIRENIHLVEQQFGLFDGISSEGAVNEIQNKYPNEYAHYKKCEDFEGKFWARMPLGESRFDVAMRVNQCFGTFHRDLDRHGIENLIVVAHGLSNRAFLMQWLHLTPEWFEAEPNPENCSIRLIENNQDKGFIYAGG